MSISSVTSEALQLKLRQLLPSQQGFGTDLSASDTIIPIIDLTSAAQGSDVPEFLQRASSLTNESFYSSAASTATVINNTGFWQLDIIATLNASFGGKTTVQITDGTSTKEIFHFERASGSSASGFVNQLLQTVIFLAAGESLTATNSTTSHNVFIAYRQVADINGVLINPSGFTPS